MSNPKADVNAITEQIMDVWDSMYGNRSVRFNKVAEILTAALTEQQAETPERAAMSLETFVAITERAETAEAKLKQAETRPTRLGCNCSAIRHNSVLHEPGCDSYKLAETRPEPCGYKFVGFPVECIKPKGHEGDHYGKFADAPTETRPEPVEYDLSKYDFPTDMNFVDGPEPDAPATVSSPTETRMPCGHLQGDMVRKYPHLDALCGSDAEEKFPEDAYCRSCKQQAEAVAQAYLRCATRIASLGIHMQLAREMERWADESVKEAGR